MHYVYLAKPRSISLLLVAALTGMVMARPELPSLGLVALTLLGGALAAGGANTLNCYLDRDLDRLMPRTARRPLPSGKLLPRQALTFGLLLCGMAIALLTAEVHWLSAALATVGVLYYVVVYTLWLKRSSPWNVVIGGGAGALPLLVGWSAVTGEISLLPLWLGAIVVCWTPPHFWSLALLRRREYVSAGVSVLPTVRGERETCRQIVCYVLLVVALTLLLSPAGFAGPVYLGAALALGGLLVFLSARLLYRYSDRAAWQLYRYSVVYLALLFGAMILDRIS